MLASSLFIMGNFQTLNKPPDYKALTKKDLSNPQIKKRFISYREAAELYGIGLTRLQEYAKKAGATYKIGNKVLVNMDIFDAFLEQYRVPGEFESMVKKCAVKKSVYER